MKYFACLLVFVVACGDDDAPMDADMPDAYDAGPPMDAGNDTGDMPDVGMPDAEVDAYDAGPMPDDIVALASTLTHDDDLDITYPHILCDGGGFRLRVAAAAIEGVPDYVYAAGWNIRTRETTALITLDENASGWEKVVPSAQVGFVCDRDYQYSFIFLAVRDDTYSSYPVAPRDFRGGVVTATREVLADRVTFSATVDVPADGGYVYGWDLRRGSYDYYALASEDDVVWTGEILFEADGLQPENPGYVLVGGIVDYEDYAIGSAAF